jgi:hypothetical protein
MRPIEQILDLISTLTLAEAKQVDHVLHQYIDQVEQWQRPGANVVEQIIAQGGCYRLELVNCGKAKCKKCTSGPAHGPYWYHYTYDSSRRRQRKTYIGKNRPS